MIRSLKFYDDSGDPEEKVPGEEIEIVAARDGRHHILTVVAYGSDLFQLDATNPEQREVLHEISELIKHTLRQGTLRMDENAREDRARGEGQS